MNDNDYMQMALALARRGEGFTAPNPIVGAVVVKDGDVVGRGWHAALGQAHAEVMALEEAGEAAAGADLYVTLEPCHHTGRTPPCTQRICQAGIRRVIVARRDPNPHVTGGGLEYLQAQGLAVTQGVGEAAARQQLAWYEKYVQTGLPLVTLKCALTLDGRIATRSGDSQWVTGPAARQKVHQMRHAADAIMIGIGTAQSDNPSLTARLEGRTTRDPMRIILDTRLSIDESAALLNQESNADTLLVTGPDHCPEKKRRLEARGARVLDCETENGRIKLEALLPHLGRMELTQLLIEGGARVSGAALAAGIVDKICFFYAPKILAGDDGVPVCRGTGPALIKDALAVKNLTATPIGEDILMEGDLS